MDFGISDDAIPTGFRGLDAVLAGGFHRGDLIIVGGRPSMGKTALAHNIATHVASSGRPVAIYSLEMSEADVTRRLLAAAAKVDPRRIDRGIVGESEWPRIAAASLQLKDLELLLHCDAALSIDELAILARRTFEDRAPPGLLVVDYVQLLGDERPTVPRHLELAGITRRLKALAVKLNTPVLAVSQLSRAVEMRADKRPLASDLRDSGALEEEADVVLLLYRDEVYDPYTLNPGVAELHVAKNRQGPEERVLLAFLPMYSRFVDFALA